MEEKVLKNSNFPTQTIKRLTRIYNKPTNNKIMIVFTSIGMAWYFWKTPMQGISNKISLRDITHL